MRKIASAHVMVRKGGIFRILDVYHHEQELFAKNGSGYIRLEAWPHTSVDGMTVYKVHWGEADGCIIPDAFKRPRFDETAPGAIEAERAAWKTGRSVNP